MFFISLKVNTESEKDFWRAGHAVVSVVVEIAKLCVESFKIHFEAAFF